MQAQSLRRAAVPVAANGGNPALGQVFRNSFFQYASNPLTFTAGTETFQQVIPIQQDGHFICAMSEFSNSLQVGASGGTVILFGGALIQLSDVSAQRFLSTSQIPVDTLFGSAQRPFVWPYTHLFRANGGIGFNITGSGAVMAGGIIRLVFSGFKIPLEQAAAMGIA